MATAWAWRTGLDERETVFPCQFVEGDSERGPLLVCQGYETLSALDPDSGLVQWTVPSPFMTWLVRDKYCACGDVPACITRVCTADSADRWQEDLLDARSGALVLTRPLHSLPCLDDKGGDDSSALEQLQLSVEARREVHAELARRGTKFGAGPVNYVDGTGFLIVRRAGDTWVVFSRSVSGVAVVRELTTPLYSAPEALDIYRVLVVPKHRCCCEVVDIRTGESQVVALAADLSRPASTTPHLFPFHVLDTRAGRRPRVWLSAYDSIVGCLEL
jgi:hypothetical protein